MRLLLIGTCDRSGVLTPESAVPSRTSRANFTMRSQRRWVKFAEYMGKTGKSRWRLRKTEGAYIENIYINVVNFHANLKLLHVCICNRFENTLISYNRNYIPGVIFYGPYCHGEPSSIFLSILKLWIIMASLSGITTCLSTWRRWITTSWRISVSKIWGMILCGTAVAASRTWQDWELAKLELRWHEWPYLQITQT